MIEKKVIYEAKDPQGMGSVEDTVVYRVKTEDACKLESFMDYENIDYTDYDSGKQAYSDELAEKVLNVFDEHRNNDHITRDKPEMKLLRDEAALCARREVAMYPVVDTLNKMESDILCDVAKNVLAYAYENFTSKRCSNLGIGPLAEDFGDRLVAQSIWDGTKLIEPAIPKETYNDQCSPLKVTYDKNQVTHTQSDYCSDVCDEYDELLSTHDKIQVMRITK